MHGSARSTAVPGVVGQLNLPLPASMVCRRNEPHQRSSVGRRGNFGFCQKPTFGQTKVEDRFVPLLLIPRPIVQTSSGRGRMFEIGERATTAECRLVGRSAIKSTILRLRDGPEVVLRQVRVYRSGCQCCAFAPLVSSLRIALPLRCIVTVVSLILAITPVPHLNTRSIRFVAMCHFGKVIGFSLIFCVLLVLGKRL